MQKFGYKHMSFILLFTSYNSFEAGLTSINKLYKGKPVNLIQQADMAELADVEGSNPSEKSCGFESHYPYSDYSYGFT